MWKAVGLLILSNVFMTFAWYGHLKYKDRALIVAKEPIRPNVIVGFLLIVAGAACVFEPWNRASWKMFQ